LALSELVSALKTASWLRRILGAGFECGGIFYHIKYWLFAIYLFAQKNVPF